MLMGKKILLTGGTGFLGTAICKMTNGLSNVVVPVHQRYPDIIEAETVYDYDLTSQSDVDSLIRSVKPDIIIHLAAEVGGIGANMLNPGRYFYSNLIMGMNLIETARKQNISKFVQIGTICSYPKHTPVPFKEESLWTGYPEETNAPYGIAKLALCTMLEAYRAQYGMNGLFLLPVNLYGPNDSFDLETSHVIPALMRKMQTAKDTNASFVECWGTGEASREFLFVEDCAEAILEATEKCNSPDPINIGSGKEILIKDLATKIKDIVGYEGEIRWNTNKPDGQPRRCLDTSRAKQEFGWEAKTDFDTGLKKTLRWYKQNAHRL